MASTFGHDLAPVVAFPASVACLVAAAQPKHYEWPRETGTDSVAFDGVLAWPAEACREAEREALVRRW